MREIEVSRLRDVVEKLCIDANKVLPTALKCKLCDAYNNEKNQLAKNVLSELVKNLDAAKQLDIPICQDTGMAVVFLEIGQDVHFCGGSLYDAVNMGVKNGYENGMLRKSIVADPLKRINTQDNTPAVIHTEIVEGEHVKITVCPKGFGSENMSEIKMLMPFDSRKGVIDAVLDIVKKAANNPCPPMVIGVGIGGDFEQCAYLAKKALCRDCDIRNIDPYYSEMEQELLDKVNSLNIGPQGFGGDATALCVNIEVAATHIAGLPVAVNIGCHVTRHKTAVI